jgi:hypothetical protein
MWKTWHDWTPDGTDQRSVLDEIARHMKSAWEFRADPGNVRFKAGHQLAHKGWKFRAGVESRDGTLALPGIKGLRALIIAGRHEWFEEASRLAPGEAVTAIDAPSQPARNLIGNLCGIATPLARFKVHGAEIWMSPEPDGWRVVDVIVDDPSAIGLSQATSATGSGCLGSAAAALVVVALGLVGAVASLQMLG